MANACHTPDSSQWHWFIDDPLYPPQMSGNDLRLEATAIFFFFRYENIDTDARAFLTLIILAIGMPGSLHSRKKIVGFPASALRVRKKRLEMSPAAFLAL